MVRCRLFLPCICASPGTYDLGTGSAYLVRFLDLKPSVGEGDWRGGIECARIWVLGLLVASDVAVRFVLLANGLRMEAADGAVLLLSHAPGGDSNIDVRTTTDVSLFILVGSIVTMGR